MFVKVLIDNRAKNNLVHEWGLAIYIEYDSHKFLLDTGASSKFVKNALAAQINLEEVEYGILSHAHYDHANGMAAFFERNKKACFYIRQGTQENCYESKWFFNKYVGIHKGFLEKYRDRILYVEGDYELVHGVYLIPHKIPGLEAIGKKNNLCVKINGQKYPDSFNHEQSLVFDTEKGLVIFNSCSHGGADNIIHEVAQTFPNKKIYAIIGGFHLFNAPQAEIKRFAERMKHTGIKKIFTGHCTGKRAFEILNAELGDKVEQFYSGMDIKL